jgi:hypothetical protein
MAKGPASKLFVIPSELQDLAGTIGALASGASLANEDGAEADQRQLTEPARRNPGSRSLPGE